MPCWTLVARLKRLGAFLPLVAILAVAGCKQTDLPPWLTGTKPVEQQTQSRPVVVPPAPVAQLPAPASAQAAQAAGLSSRPLPPPPPPAPIKVENLAPVIQQPVLSPAPQPLPIPAQPQPVVAPQMAALPAPTPLPVSDKEEVRAALLVPLSGPQAALGQAMSNAAQLALFDVADKGFNLIPLDTKGTPDGAQAAMRLATDQGADIILGPLFSAEVKAIAPMARERSLPVLSFTTDRQVLGNGIYSLGFLPANQVGRMVAFAKDKGRDRIAALVRGDDYGRAIAEALRQAAQQLGAMVVKVEYYDPQAQDLSGLVKKFTDYDRRTAARSKDPAQPVAPPAFDAVLLPDEGVRLKTIASTITYYEIDPGQVLFLGTLLWDDPRLNGEPALMGGVYPAPAAAAHQDFDQRFGKAFGALPPRLSALASMAYDSAALAASLGKNGHADYGIVALTDAKGFAGSDGLFRLLPDGTAERGLSVREIGKNASREVEPAPAGFIIPPTVSR